MIDVKTAVHAARSFFNELYLDQQLPDVRLEEVELSEDERYWHITFGFTRPEMSGTTTFLAGNPPARDYKRITVRADDARVEGMTIRNVG